MPTVFNSLTKHLQSTSNVNEVKLQVYSRVKTTVAYAAALEAAKTALGIEVGPSRNVKMGGGSEDPTTIQNATLHRASSSAAAYATVRASLYSSDYTLPQFALSRCTNRRLG
ncbi:hypothetical protein RB195_023782 [Necator americanus]|uniref:Uncharacterized protein n=1 Tax=Necator americanus TaxID=51031 RepID=A0ABR1EMW7_NECAM